MNSKSAECRSVIEMVFASRIRVQIKINMAAYVKEGMEETVFYLQQPPVNVTCVLTGLSHPL